MRISGGVSENGVVTGNTYDKYGAGNPIVRRIMKGFDDALAELTDAASPATIHDVGCGEGYWVFRALERGIPAVGTDFSTHVIDLARSNARERGVPAERFQVGSIYELEQAKHSADLVLCCEVLEHLEHPARALEALAALDARHYIFSVPREPLWCCLNMARGKYLRALGNTPGHLQHWSTRAFIRFVSQYFNVVEVRTPLPWTMVLCRSGRSDFP